MRKLKNILWWFKYRFISKHKYNILKTGLKPGYYDPDISIPAAILETTKQFVDGNNKWGRINWNSDDGHKEAWDAFCNAASWWVENKEKFELGMNIYLDHPGDLEFHDAEEHCKKVINYINYMWYV